MPRKSAAVAASAQRRVSMPSFAADLFKRTAAQIVKEILAATVFRVLETLGHHLRRLQMPEIDVFGVVATQEEI